MASRGKTGFNPKEFDPQRYKDLPPGSAREALGETSQKLAGLAITIDGLPVMDPDFLLPWLGQACPPGWELVAEMDGLVLLGTTETAADVGTTGGNASHTHTLTLTDHAPAGGLRNINSAAAGTALTVADNTHTHGNTGTAASASHLPPYMKVLFCRRIR